MINRWPLVPESLVHGGLLADSAGETADWQPMSRRLVRETSRPSGG